MDDPRPMFAVALDQAEEVVAAVRPEQLGLATPCPGADVRMVLWRLLRVVRELSERAAPGGPVTGPPPARVPPRRPPVPTAAGERPPGWVLAWVRERARYEAAWGEREVLGRALEAAAGRLPGRTVLALHVPAVVVHGCDLAVALGRPEALREDLGRFALSLVRRTVPAAARRPVQARGGVVPVPAAAGVHVELARWLGRAAG